MKIKRFFALLLALVMLSVITLAGCGSQTGNSGGSGDATNKVSLAAARDTQLSPVILCAAEKGFFKEYGIDAEVTLFASGADLVTAVASGDVDLGSAGDTPATSLLTSDPGKYEFIARTTNLGGALALVVKEGIQNPSDLEGKKIGYSIGNTSEALWLALVKETGIAAEKVTMISLGTADMLTAFESGQIDGFVCWEPTITNAVKRGGHRLLTGTKSYFDGVEAEFDCLNSYALLVGKAAWIKENPKTVTAVLSAMNKSVEWINENLSEAAKIVAKALNLDEADCLRMMERNEYGLGVTDTVIADLGNSAQFLYDGGKINVIPDFNEMFNGTFLSQIDESLVSVSK